MSEFITTTAEDRDDDGEVLAADRERDQEAGNALDEVCEPDFIDGRYYGCGACPACEDQADIDDD